MFSGTKVIPLGKSIQKYFDSYPQYNSFELESGIYSGPVVFNRKIKLVGQDKSVIKSTGKKTTIRIEADYSQLMNITVDGSGHRYDLTDAAIYVGANHVIVANNIVTNATFGIVVEKVNQVKVKQNLIYGNRDRTMGLRGDGIRVWETRDSLIESNELINSRDIVFWYSSSNELRYNKMINGRYGTHYMYSHHNEVHHNKYVSNVVGTFIMYSRGIVFTQNYFVGASGLAGYGLGVKESGNLFFSNNYFIQNTTGIYLDTSPYDEREKNVFFENTIAISETGIQFHGKPKHNRFERNSLIQNSKQVDVDGNSTANDIIWTHNYFEDYEGYDIDRDLVGDVPYQYRKLVSDLVTKFPSLDFFRGTVAFYLINIIGKAIPLFQPSLMMEDKFPLIKNDI